MQRAVARNLAVLSFLALFASMIAPANAHCPPGVDCPGMGPPGGPGPSVGGRGPFIGGHGPRGGGGDVGAALAGGLLGGMLGAAMTNAAAAPPPSDIPSCAAYQAIVNEDIAAGVRADLYHQDYSRLQACLRRSAH
jgi:hypothetical protein